MPVANCVSSSDSPRSSDGVFHLLCAPIALLGGSPDWYGAHTHGLLTAQNNSAISAADMPVRIIINSNILGVRPFCCVRATGFYIIVCIIYNSDL